MSSLVLNWVVGPALMFTLAWLLLPDLPAYRTGLIIVGLARCIAMVIIWNDLACGDREAAAVLVALNSRLPGPRVRRARLVLPRGCCPAGSGLDTADARRVAVADRQVRADLPRHPAAGRATCPARSGERARGREWYESTFLPRIGPWALYGLLFTIVILFALQGDQITSNPLGRRPDRPAAAGLLRDHVGRRLPARQGARHDLRADHDAGVHRRRQQLRARHRGRHRHLRRHLRPGARRRRRARSSRCRCWSASSTSRLALRGPLTPTNRPGSAADDPTTSHRPVRLRPQRRPLADGRRLPAPPRRRPGRGPLRRLGARRQRSTRPRCEAMAEDGIDITAECPSCSPPRPCASPTS